MQLQPVTVVLALCAAGAAARAHTPYREHTPRGATLDYDEQLGIDIQRTRLEETEEIEDDDDTTDTYNSDARYESRERYRHPQVTFLNDSYAITEQWNDDIEVDIHHRIFTKKNKVAKTGRSEYDKLKFAYKLTTKISRIKSKLKYSGSLDVDKDHTVQQESEDSEDRDWRGGEKKINTKQVVEESEERPQWILAPAEPRGHFDYYDVKRLNKYKSNFLPPNHKRTEKMPRDVLASVSPTSLAERELQAYLNGHRLRKAVDVWSSTTECDTEEPEGAVSSQSAASSLETHPGQPPGQSPDQRRGQHPGQRRGQRPVVAGGGLQSAGAPSLVFSNMALNNFTFSPGAVDYALAEQWNHFISETRNQAVEPRADTVLFIRFTIILSCLQSYNQFYYF